MAKTKLRRLHKIKVHHNRWLLWAISYAVIVAIAVWGYIHVTDIDFEQTVKAQNEFQSSQAYRDSRLGFSLRYPSNWWIESGEDSVTFEPTTSNETGVTISRLPLTAEKGLRSTLNIQEEESIEVDGVTGTSIINDLGSGALETIVLAKHDGYLYSIVGSKSLVRHILVTFKFTN